MTTRLYFLLLASTLSGCSRPQQAHLLKKDIVETVYASGKITSSDEYNLFAFSNGAIRQKLVRMETLCKELNDYFISSDRTAWYTRLSKRKEKVCVQESRTLSEPSAGVSSGWLWTRKMSIR